MKMTAFIAAAIAALLGCCLVAASRLDDAWIPKEFR